MTPEFIQNNYRAHFRKLEKNTTNRAYLILTSYIVQILSCFVVGYAALNLSPELKIPCIAILMIILATRFRGLNNIIHECCHLTFCEDKKQNFHVGSIAASLLFTTYTDYRNEHMTHHMHLGDFEHDQDFMHRKVFRFDDKLSPKVVIRHILTPILLIHIWHYFSLNFSARDGRVYQILKFALAGMIGMALILAPMATILLYIIPFVWIFSAVNYWTDCVDHAGLITRDDVMEQSRNIFLPKWLRPIFFPRNDSYHLIHHLFPNIPVQHFDRCHEILMSESEYRHTVRKTTGKFVFGVDIGIEPEFANNHG